VLNKGGYYNMYKQIKTWYNQHIYTNADVAEFVKAKTITPEQYEEITGEPYNG